MRQTKYVKYLSYIDLITKLYNKNCSNQTTQNKMCFLPLGCLKAITTIGSVLSIVISFALLGVTIYANVQKGEIIDKTSQGAVNTSLVFLYIGSIVFLLLGIAGLYGSLKGGKDKRGNRCLLGLYSIGVLVFFLAFLGATIFFFLGPKAIFGADCRSGAAASLNVQLYNKSSEVGTKFCNATCPCYVDSKNIQLLKKLNQNGYFNVTQTSTDPVKYQQCQSYNSTEESKSVLLLAALEQFLGCGGWCPQEQFRFYRFTNINSCTTLDCLNNLPACYTAFDDFMMSKGEIIGYACLLACLICLINVLTICCICCHPTKSGKSKNFYSRMLDTQN